LAENLRAHRDIYPEELSEVIELIAGYGSFQLNTSEELSIAPEMTFEREIQEVEGRHNEDGIWLSKDQMSSLTQISGDMILLKNSFQIPKELSRSLNLLSDQFQEILDKAQKIPLTEAFSGLSTLIRQAAYELKKDVRFEDFGFELEIDKLLASDLYKALIHMVRNSIDHGIETPQERIQVGKSRQGVLKIKVEERISVIHCEIKDDGKGLDKDRILQRALEKGLTNILDASQMSEANIFAFIFHPGFSTKKAITTISGRGVGMDVVKNIVTKYGGHIEVQSKTGEGSTIHLSIPVPRKLHVEHCLLGEWQDFSLAFSLSDISHVSSCDELQVTDIDGLRFCQFDGKTVPLLTLEEIYKSKMSVNINQVKVMSVVFLKSKDSHLGFLVDRIQHQADLLIKTFGNLIKSSPGFKGNSVLADGQISYVVDCAALCSLLKKEKM
jgi:two-component system chemotaxis sensor kinase CheA